MSGHPCSSVSAYVLDLRQSDLFGFIIYPQYSRGDFVTHGRKADSNAAVDTRASKSRDLKERVDSDPDVDEYAKIMHSDHRSCYPRTDRNRGRAARPFVAIQWHPLAILPEQGRSASSDFSV
jgi:hypothetical protein